MRPLTSGGGRPANDRLIARHLRGWKNLVAGWKASREAKAAREAAAREANAPRDDGNSAPPGRLASASAFPFNAAAPAFVPSVALPPAPPVPVLTRTVNGKGQLAVRVTQAPAPAPARADWGELPEAFTVATKRFRTLRELADMVRGDSVSAPLARIQTLGNFVSEGGRQIQAVQAMRSSYPPGSRVTIAWRLVNWKCEISCWDVAAMEVTLHALRDARMWAKIHDAEQHLVRAKQCQEEACQRLDFYKPTWLKHRAKQRKKRTCSHCGTTAPFSARAFPYCGACRHSDPSVESMRVVEPDCVVVGGQLDVPAGVTVVQADAVHWLVPRVDRPRYCSEECQRAHWLAGHMNECPSCTG